MADINLGDVVARLKLDATEFTRGLQQAQQALTQFGQAKDQVIQNLQRLNTSTQSASATFNQFNQTNQQLHQTINQGNQTFQTFNTTINNITNSVNQSRHGAQGFGETWRNIFQIASGIGLATSIQGIVGALKDFAVAAVEAGARMESLRNSLAALSGSQIQGRQEFDQLFQTAQRLGVAFEPLARGFRQITAAATQAGVPLQDQMRLLTALATEGRRLGLSNEEMGRSITAVAQIFSKGKVAMEELRQQLGEALPTTITAFARGMGIAVQEVEKFVEAGVSATRAGAALTRGFEALQREGGSVADGLREGFNQFGNELLKTKDILTSLVGPLTSLLGVMTKGLEAVNKLADARRLLRETTGQEAILGAGLRAGDLGRLPAADQRRFKEIQDLIAKQTETPILGISQESLIPPEIREKNVVALKEEAAALLAKAGALKDANEGQEKATAAAAAAVDLQKEQVATNKALLEQLDALTKAREDFRRKATLAPELFGRPAGSLAEQQTFQKGLDEATKASLEKVTAAMTKLPPGVTLTDETTARLKTELGTYSEIQKALAALDAQKDAAAKAEQERRRAAAEAEQQAHAAIRQEIDLRALLARTQEEIARGTQSPAEQARTRVLEQSATQRRALEQAQRQLAESPALRARAPEAAGQIQQILTDLDTTTAQRAGRAFEASLEEQFVKPLQALAEQYGAVKAARDLDKASADAYALVGSKFEEQALTQLELIRGSAEIEAKLPQLRREAAASAPAGELAIKRTQDEAEALKTLQENLEGARASAPGAGGFPFGQTREELRLQQRTREEIRSPEGLAEAKRLEEAYHQQLQLNYAAGLFADLAGSIGQAWGGALQGIADHTKTVSEAFREMARSILQSLTQIASQEAFKQLTKLGVSLITAAVGGGVGTSQFPVGAQGPVGGGGDLATTFAQGGAIVNRPTTVLAGENPHMNPEFILNRPQMQALMSSAVRAAPSAGGQAAGGQGVVIVNVANQDQANEQAAKYRGLGYDVTVNHVLQDLGRGESSRISRVLRTTQR